MHGSWVLINGEVETEITWDTSCLAEDFWFAYQVGSRFNVHVLMQAAGLEAELVDLSSNV